MNCIFCKIINKEIPSYIVYEDDLVVSFLDINPRSKGHILIVPKEHYENLLDIDLDTLFHINKISKKIYSLLKDKLNIEGLTIEQNNEYGQDVKHYHMHLIPRYKSVNKESNIEKTYELLK